MELPGPSSVIPHSRFVPRLCSGETVTRCRVPTLVGPAFARQVDPMLISSERRYQGRVIHLDLDTVEFPDGSRGQLEMIRHPGASAVVPILDDPGSDDPEVLLLRQFRHAAEGFIWEIPAGRLDPGESPEECAERELAEETGMRAGRLERLTTIYTTPGFTDERIHLFLASGLEEGAHRREADEFMEVRRFPWSRVTGMVEAGEVQDAKTLVAFMFVELFRMRRRGEEAGRVWR
jgi:ADP-ribose pyrophosphatase